METLKSNILHHPVQANNSAFQSLNMRPYSRSKTTNEIRVIYGL